MNKELGVSIGQGVSAEQDVRGLTQINKGSQLNKESRVSIEQGLSAKQRVRGLI